MLLCGVKLCIVPLELGCNNMLKSSCSASYLLFCEQCVCVSELQKGKKETFKVFQWLNAEEQ